MSKINQLLEKLGKHQKSGKGYRTACPVHGSKGATLSVTPKDKDYIVAHCFSCGAGGPEVCEVLGLPISILFPDDEYKPPEITKDMKRQNIEDAFFSQFAKGQKLSLNDTRTLRKASERLKGFDIKSEQAGEEYPPVDHPALKLYSVDYGEAVEKSGALREELVENHWRGVEERVRHDDLSSENRFTTSETILPTSETRLTKKNEIEDWLNQF